MASVFLKQLEETKFEAMKLADSESSLTSRKRATEKLIVEETQKDEPAPRLRELFKQKHKLHLQQYIIGAFADYIDYANQNLGEHDEDNERLSFMDVGDVGTQFEKFHHRFAQDRVPTVPICVRSITR